MPEPADPQWRVGWHTNPLGVHRPSAKFDGRFDDPERKYLVIYSADTEETAIREVLQRFQPDIDAIAERDALDPGATDPRTVVQGPVSLTWLNERRLVAGHPTFDAGAWFADLYDVDVRRDLVRKHATELQALGIKDLDVGQISGEDLALTQAISRFIYERDAAGLLYRSKLTSEYCGALYEDRARLEPVTEDWGQPKLLTDYAEFDDLLDRMDLRLHDPSAAKPK